jgi:hypothetical protein
MPKPNRNVLQYLISFLAYVASFSDKNKMNCTNLSIVVGPNLVRPVQVFVFLHLHAYNLITYLRILSKQL